MAQANIPNKRKALVTGASGFTGHHMVMEAVKAGFDVRATDVSSRYYGAMFEALGVEFVASDLTKSAGLESLVDGIDVVFHVAGIHDYSTPRDVMFAINVAAVENLCAACVDAGVDRFIHLSSAGVYGYDWHDAKPVSEDSPKLTPPLNVYNESKWEGEKVVQRYVAEKGLKATVIRPAAIYGTRSEYGIYNAIKHVYDDRNKKRMTLVGSGNNIEGFVHVEDVCRAMIWAADDESAIGEAYNVADDSRLTTAEFFNLVAKELLGQEKGFVRVPIRLLIPVAAVSQFFAKRTGTKPKLEKDTLHYMSCDRIWDNTKIKQAGFRLNHPTVETGMKPTLAWYKENGWLRV
jgi:UDP-glucose 4-epimerase